MQPTDEKYFTYQVLKGTVTNTKLTLSQDVTDKFNKKSTDIETSTDEVKAVTAWDKKYKTSIDVIDVDREISVADNSTLKYMVKRTTEHRESTIGDTLALVNQSTNHTEKAFTTSDATEEYRTTSNLGETKGETLNITGAKDGENISTIYLGSFTGFDVKDATTLNFTDVVVKGQDFVVRTTNAGSVINVNANSELAGDVISAGTLNNSGVISGNLTNNGVATSEADNLRGAIENNGTLNTKGTLLSYVTGNGNLNTTGDLKLTEKAGVQGTLTLNDITLTVSKDKVAKHNFGMVTGKSNLELDLDFTGDTVVGDVLKADTFKDAELTITSLNAMGDKTKSFEYTLLDGVRENVTLTLTQDVKDAYHTDFETREAHTLDAVTTAKWDDVLETYTDVYTNKGRYRSSR